jgi:hypothetical protein
MKRPLRFLLTLAVALGFVPFLPLYLERTMMRSWRMDHAGDIIEWGWKICSLREYWSDYPYISPEQNPAFWLAVNLVLAFAYALIIALIIDRVLVRRRRKQAPAQLT